MPRRDKRDVNEPDIIRWLESVGATVERLPPGNGRPDLLVGFRGENYLIEVKSEKGSLRKNQVEWHGRWRGQRSVAKTPEEALRIIGAAA